MGHTATTAEKVRYYNTCRQAYVARRRSGPSAAPKAFHYLAWLCHFHVLSGPRAKERPRASGTRPSLALPGNQLSPAPPWHRHSDPRRSCSAGRPTLSRKGGKTSPKEKAQTNLKDGAGGHRAGRRRSRHAHGDSDVTSVYSRSGRRGRLLLRLMPCPSSNSSRRPAVITEDECGRRRTRMWR